MIKLLLKCMWWELSLFDQSCKLDLRLSDINSHIYLNVIYNKRVKNSTRASINEKLYKTLYDKCKPCPPLSSFNNFRQIPDICWVNWLEIPHVLDPGNPFKTATPPPSTEKNHLKINLVYFRKLPFLDLNSIFDKSSIQKSIQL